MQNDNAYAFSVVGVSVKATDLNWSIGVNFASPLIFLLCDFHVLEVQSGSY